MQTRCELCNEEGHPQYDRAHLQALSLARSELRDLDVLLTEHLGREPLDEHFCCSSCNTRGHGVKNTEVIEWPPVLIITLKRFEFDVATRSIKKKQDHVRYPMLLPLRAGLTYRLRAIIEHQGGDQGGHYVAHVRAQGDDWYYFNDTMPPQRILNPMSVVQRQAYMLIYER